MQRDYKKLQVVLSVIVIVVLMAYAFIAYMPHGHEYVDSDCVICNMAESKDNFLINVEHLSAIPLLPPLMLILLTVHERIVSLGESTPVGLKVKLSD